MDINYFFGLLMPTVLSISFSLEETAVREVYEETGVKSGNAFKILSRRHCMKHGYQ